MAGPKGYKSKVYAFQDGAHILFITSNFKVAFDYLYFLVPGHFHFVLREYSVYTRRLKNSHAIVVRLPSDQVLMIKRFIIKKKFSAHDFKPKK